METTAAKNYLENTNLKFKFKAGAAIGTAAYLLILVLIEEIAGAVLPSFWGDIYLIGGIALMVITGSIFKALKVAKGVFKWGYLLTPFVLFDVVIAVIAGRWRWIHLIYTKNARMQNSIYKSRGGNQYEETKRI